MEQSVGALERLLRRDRAIGAAALGLLTLLAWVATVRTAQTMSTMKSMADGVDAMSLPGMTAWQPGQLVALFTMWLVMMIAMMVPSAAPIVLLYLAVLRRRHASRLPFAPTAAFLGGYVLVWAGFSLIATLAQWGLHRAALLSADAMRATPAVAGILLVAAGAFQWTDAKRACLTHCRSPIHFFSTEWRDGTLGGVVMGVRHGAWCVGCCWLLMALLFVAGVMNLAWVAALAILVLLEKGAPAGPWLGRVVGVGVAVWGVWLLLRSVVQA